MLSAIPISRTAGLLLAAILAANAAHADNPAWTANAEKKLSAAREHFRASPADTNAAVQFGRACFDRAEFATNHTQRAVLAVEGIAAMRELAARQPRLAAGHYYLAMNLGQLARTKMLGALRIVDEMEREFKTARELDERLDFAGPDRNLGELYLQAPGWPTSIGSRPKARKHLERAAELSPDYPENQINLAEAYAKWNLPKDFQRQMAALQNNCPAAQTNFTGADWAASLADWTARRTALENRARQKIRPAR